MNKETCEELHDRCKKKVPRMAKVCDTAAPKISSQTDKTRCSRKEPKTSNRKSMKHHNLKVREVPNA